MWSLAFCGLEEVPMAGGIPSKPIANRRTFVTPAVRGAAKSNAQVKSTTPTRRAAAGRDADAMDARPRSREWPASAAGRDALRAKIERKLKKYFFFLQKITI